MRNAVCFYIMLTYVSYSVAGPTVAQLDFFLAMSVCESCALFFV